MKQTTLWKRVAMGFRDKYLALATVSLFLSIFAHGQKYDGTLSRAFGIDVQRLDPGKVLLLPTGCGSPTTGTLSRTDSAKKKAAIYFDSCYGRIYVFNPRLTTWDTVAIGGGSGGGYLDSALFVTLTRLSDSVNVRVSSIYRSHDSVFTCYNGTCAFAYKDSTGGGSGGGTPITNTGSFYRFVVPSSQAVKTLANNWGALIDSTTNSGSLTIWVDSSVAASKGYALSLYDLLNASKLNKSDTGTMLTPYLRKADTTAMLLPYFRKADTTAMLTPYLRKADTATISNRINLKADKATTLNINGLTQDLSANRTWTIVPTDTSIANVMAYGAYGDGTHSDAWAFLLAIASNKPVYVPPGNYKLNDTMLILNDYQKIYGNGFLSTLITSYAGGGAYFGIIRSGKYNTIYNLRFVGTGKVTYPVSTLTEQNAIMLSGNHNDVSSCFFENIGGAAVNMLKPGFDSVWFNNVSYLQMRECTAGIQTLINAQYNTFSNINAQYLNRAVYDGNGNNTWVNINGEDCNEGHVLGGSGGNNNHGTLIASKYNHTSYPFVATGGIDVEYVVSATKFYGGIINLTDCDNLWFQNCSLSTNTINITASSTAKKVHFTDCPHLGPLLGAITWNVTGTAVLDTSLISGFNSGVTIPLDSTNYKLAVIDANGNPRKMFWPTYGGGGGSSRMAISTHSVGTDANITAAAGYVYDLPAATLSTNRNFDVTALNTDGDYIEILYNEAGFTWTFTGATVYLIDRTTTVTTLTTASFYQLRRINGKIIIIN